MNDGDDGGGSGSVQYPLAVTPVTAGLCSDKDRALMSKGMSKHARI